MIPRDRKNKTGKNVNHIAHNLYLAKNMHDILVCLTMVTKPNNSKQGTVHNTPLLFICYFKFGLLVRINREKSHLILYNQYTIFCATNQIYHKNIAPIL